MNTLTFDARDEADTDRLGAALAASVPDGVVVALLGTLGAGKTRLVQAVAAACGVPRDDVVSPTFVLCQTYHGRRMLHHLDAYRMKDDDEFLELGPDELFESEAMTLVEWADRVASCLPAERLELHIEVTGERTRRFRLHATSDRLATIIDAVARQLN
jgi:tRNA threonylcarbamoyladenosine biosynthesis protein TsaE